MVKLQYSLDLICNTNGRFPWILPYKVLTSVLLGIKGTWYEYGTIVKTQKISQPTVSKSATSGEKNTKENKIKLLKNK